MALNLTRLLGAMAAALLLAGPAAAEGRMKVVTTFTVIADMAGRVAGDASDVVSITKPGAEIHGYEPTPQDIVRAQGADLILWNGMNLERWFEQFLANLGDVPAREPVPKDAAAQVAAQQQLEDARRAAQSADAALRARGVGRARNGQSDLIIPAAPPSMPTELPQ